MEQQKVYGYVRVSSNDQNESRQIQALDDYGITKDRIFVDKVSGKDFNRQEYQTLKRMLKDSPHSLLVITSIDRLGRCYCQYRNVIFFEFKNERFCTFLYSIFLSYLNSKKLC